MKRYIRKYKPKRKYYIYYATLKWNRGKKPIRDYRRAKMIVEDMKRKGIKAYLKKGQKGQRYITA